MFQSFQYQSNAICVNKSDAFSLLRKIPYKIDSPLNLILLIEFLVYKYPILEIKHHIVWSKMKT